MPPEIPDGFLTAKMAADVIQISRPNLQRWLDRHCPGLPDDVRPHPVGRLWRRERIEAARDRWLEERDRGSDEKRRASALANATREDPNE